MFNAQPAEASPAASESKAEEEAPESQRRPTSSSAPEAIFWHGLITGALCLVDATCDASSCVAVLRQHNGHATKLSSLEQRLLCRAFHGEPQKNLAFEFDVSPATISQLLGTARAKLGLRERMTSAPLPIVLLALGHCGATALPPVRFGRFQRDGQEYLELGWSPLDPAALTELSQGERNVALWVAWGANHKQIADQRHTSKHTVANQIASICAKLRIHGRFELIRRWAERQWGMHASRAPAVDSVNPRDWTTAALTPEQQPII
jgi:DNA-binding CsgD family transcriptional regulator